MTVALVAACFITVPVVRADNGLLDPEGLQNEKVGRQLVIRGANTNPQHGFASSNDTCAGADAIPAGSYPVLSTIQNIGANTDAGDPPAPSCSAAGNAAQGAAWWKFTPTETNTYFFNDCNVQAPGTTHDDTIIGVYSSSDGTCGGTLTEIGCSDDANICPGFPFLSKASAVMNSGQTYYIVVWNWADPPATADVQIEVTKSLAPSNDACAGATALPLNRTVRGTLLSANNDYSLANASCYTGVVNNSNGVCLANGRDIVYSFTAPAAGSYSIRARSETSVAVDLVLYTATSCPGLGSTCPGVITAASEKNYTGNAFNARESVTCQTLAAGQTIFAIVDECTVTTAGNTVSVEALPCYPETEPNDTPATASAAPSAGVSPIEGNINPGTDVDFFSLGTPPAGSRVFAWVDTNSLNNLAAPAPTTGDLDMRVTTDVDTLEYDDQDTDTEGGTLAPAIAGRALTGVPSYLRINHRTGAAGDTYFLYSAIQPPGFGQFGTSASDEANEGTNDDFPGAETAGNNFWAGTLFNSTDLDLFRVCAALGDVLVFQADNDPSRLAPIPGRTLVTAFSAITGGQIGPYSGFNNPGSQAKSTVPGTGSLTATTPFGPSEVWEWRAEYSGPHFGYIDMRAAPTLVNGQPYLFSATVNGQTGAEMSVDLQLTKTGPDTAAAGDVVVYDITLTNNGPSIATFASFFDQLPDGTAFVGFGLDGVDDLFGSCDAPPPGDVGGAVSCTFDCLPPGRTITIQVAVQVFPCIGDGFQLFNQIFANTVTNMTPESTTFASWTTNITDDGTCEADGDLCTTDACDSGVCVQGGPVDPNDNNACTDDSCDPDTGVHNDPNTAACDDGNACTSGDVCADGSCTSGAPVDPNDGNACTDDSCDPGTGVHNDPNTAPCNDGNACTTGDTCGGGSCQPGGGTLNCDDSNPCTDDFCAGGCQHTNNTDPCDDGNPSTVNDTCSGGVCSGVSGCTPGGRPKSKGYYYSLCQAPHSGDTLTAADAACVASLGGTFSDVTSVADVCAALHTTGSDKCLKAEEDLMATALNICKQKVCETQPIDSACSSYTTVGESYDAADAALSNPSRTDATCDAADCQAKEINNGKALEANSLAITSVAGQIRLDWETPLLENPAQLQGYKVYRRAVGSTAAFTQIGTTADPHFVDPTGMSGNFEYEIVAY